ncbi:MAG: restriction endonuclease subunit S, partial [Oscillospiraceae bacterium]|nr:restriction endonuclease subunit S [Oscillospiraceae bacterium]
PKSNIVDYWDGDFRWITPAELDAASWYIYDSERKLTEAGVKSCSLTEMPAGTVLLSSRAPIGKVAIAGDTFFCNQGFKNIICGDKMHPVFLYMLLVMNKDYLNSLGRGATFKEISKSIVENIRIPVPPFAEQEVFAEFCKQIDKSKSAIQKSLDETQILFDSLMQKYFG